MWTDLVWFNSVGSFCVIFRGRKIMGLCFEIIFLCFSLCFGGKISMMLLRIRYLVQLPSLCMRLILGEKYSSAFGICSFVWILYVIHGEHKTYLFFLNSSFASTLWSFFNFSKSGNISFSFFRIWQLFCILHNSGKNYSYIKFSVNIDQFFSLMMRSYT